MLREQCLKQEWCAIVHRAWTEILFLDKQTSKVRPTLFEREVAFNFAYELVSEGQHAGEHENRDFGEGDSPLHAIRHVHRGFEPTTGDEQKAFLLIDVILNRRELFEVLVCRVFANEELVANAFVSSMQSTVSPDVLLVTHVAVVEEPAQSEEVSLGKEAGFNNQVYISQLYRRTNLQHFLHAVGSQAVKGSVRQF